MKKRLVLLAAFGLLLALFGCSQGQAAPEGTASEIAAKVFDLSKVEPFGMEQNLASDPDLAFFLGSSDYPAFSDAVAVMPMINLDTRVLTIIKAADKGDVEEIKTKLEANIDPNRVVCVTFTLDDVAIESRGDVIMMTINTDAEQRTAMVEAFQSID